MKTASSRPDGTRLPAVLAAGIGTPIPELTPRPVGLIVAVNSEAAILRKVMRSWVGLVPHVEVSGMGHAAAARAAERLAGRGVSGLMSFGYAGAIRPGIRRGAVVVADSVEAHDGEHYETDSYWRAELAQALSGLADIRVGSFKSVRQVVSTATDKHHLAGRTSALAVDMESGAIAGVARRYGLPFIAVRAIVDEAHHAVPAIVSGAVDHTGRTRAWRIAWPLVKDPGQLKALIALAKGADAANRALLEVCRRAGPGFRLV